MSLPPKKNDNVIGDLDALFNKRLPVNVLDDSQWLFIRKRFHMSPRELDVAKLVCGGLSNEVIATRLGIKSATVKTHLRNVYRRIRVQRKLDMLLIFLDQSAKYANPASDIKMAVVKNQAVGKSGLKTTIGDQGQIAGR
jgi:DNA-binding CsgD family transcriptional regulator